MNGMNRQKAMNLIGLAMRAGKMITGEELTIGDIRRQKAKIVFVASDASENTRKKKSKIRVRTTKFLALSCFLRKKSRR